MIARGGEVLADARKRVLRIARHLVAWGAIPTLLLTLLAATRAGRSIALMLGELVLLGLGGAVLWIDRERRPERGARVLTTMLFAITAVALAQFGPLMGTGAMMLGWALFVVFFHESAWGALAGVAVQCGAALAWIGQRGLPSSWPALPDGVGGLVRVSSTVLLLTAASSYLFLRLLAALRRAIDLEHEAREREATARAEQQEAERALADGRRLEAVGQLAGGAAHDFNNVLTVITSGLYALRDASARDRAELLDQLDRNVEMARATTRQLLSFAKQGSNPADRANPAESVATFARALTRLLPESIQVVPDIAAVPHVPLSSGALEQALLNLSLNARDAMPEGGTLTLRCKPHPSALGRVLIEVEDTGRGLVGEALSRAGKGVSSKPNGAGLGLRMVRRTIEDAGGSVVIGAGAAGGARVTLELPASASGLFEIRPEARAAPAEAPHPKEKPAEVRDATPAATPESGADAVLLLEDEPDVRRALARLLTRAGKRVVTAASVAQALAALDQHGAFALLLSDASLPDGDASPVIRRALADGTPVIVCSGHVDAEEMLAEVTRSEVRFLQKPIKPSELIAQVDKALAETKAATASAPRSA